jgi:pimeloyl-ACP methyl ester carboxylesterase
MTARTITAHSADGTPVRFTSYGSGPPIVLIHGAFSTSADYRLVGDMLASNHEVLLLERRGSGSPATDLTGARFAQDGRDIVAVLDRLDMPALLFGHSAGAVAALEATRAA